MPKAVENEDVASREGYIPEVYESLRNIARKYLSARASHTLQPTALVNEALLAFVGKGQSQWKSPAHFQACAAQMMRWILLDHAKAKRREKRGGGGIRVTFNEELHGGGSELDMLALDEALKRLAKEDERAARIVELRFFGGMGVEEIAQALEISTGTVKRDWAVAKAWLFREFQITGKKAG